MKKILSSFIILSVLLLFGFNRQTSAVHRFHTSFTQMDYNQDKKIIEVTIRLFSHDFEDVFRKITKKNVNPEKIKDIDSILLKYLNSNFVLKDKDEDQQKLRWVGKEFEVDTLYVYVEIPFEEKFESLRLKNSIFFEYYPEQTNYVTSRLKDEKVDLFYKVGDSFKEIINKSNERKK